MIFMGIPYRAVARPRKEKIQGCAFKQPKEGDKMAELRHINALLSEDQVERVQHYMNEKNIRGFSDGLREYVRHIEAKLPAQKEKVSVAA